MRFKNPNTPGEVTDSGRLTGEWFYFWRITDTDPVQQNRVNFSRYAPGEGVLVMHTDFGDNAEGLPQQQRIGTHFMYSIVQADGLHQLEAGVNQGDIGDPFPGSDGITVWNAQTDPGSRWWGQIRSGLEIRDVQHYDNYSVVNFFWKQFIVPELTFNRPPAFMVVNDFLNLNYEAFDGWGGTRLHFYYDTDGSGYDGTLVGSQVKSDTGIVQQEFAVPVALLTDGDAYFYARLEPGPGQDGITDPSFSPPRADVGNRGRGKVVDHVTYGTHIGYPETTPKSVFVDTSLSFLEMWHLICVNDAVAGAELWRVEGSLSGVQQDGTGADLLATTGAAYQTADGSVQFTIISQAEVGTSADVTNYGGQYMLEDLSATFVASEFKPKDIVRITSGTGVNLGFYTIVSVPTEHSLRLSADAGDSLGAGDVSYRIHAFSQGSPDGSQPPDRFQFQTTGKTPYSLPVLIQAGQIVPQLYPAVTVTYPEDESNPGREVPLLVQFDATGTLDEFGQPSDLLEYSWDFGDGLANDMGQIRGHTYTTVDGMEVTEPTDVTVTLTVTNPGNGLEATKQVVVRVYPVFVDNDGRRRGRP